MLQHSGAHFMNSNVLPHALAGSESRGKSSFKPKRPKSRTLETSLPIRIHEVDPAKLDSIPEVSGRPQYPKSPGWSGHIEADLVASVAVVKVTTNAPKQTDHPRLRRSWLCLFTMFAVAAATVAAFLIVFKPTKIPIAQHYSNLVKASQKFGLPQDIAGLQSADTASAIEATMSYMNSNDFLELPEKVRSNCVNQRPLCSYWKVSGECEKNQHYLSAICGPACNACSVFTGAQLRAAAANGDINLLLGYLISNPDLVNEEDEKGWTALHFAVRAGSGVVVDKLLQYGANVHARTLGHGSALDIAYASIQGDHARVAALLEDHVDQEDRY